MRQTNLCLNRVFKFNKFYVNLYPGGSRKLWCLRKKCAMKIERKKQRKIKKMTGALYKLSQRSERRRRSLNQGLMDHFIAGDIDSI